MSVSTQPAKPAEPTVHPRTGIIPPLENGDRLTRAEFERRYEAMPNLKKAELIEGEVYMPSPVLSRRHSHPHSRLVAGWGFMKWTRPASRGAITVPSVWTWTTNPSPTLS